MNNEKTLSRLAAIQTIYSYKIDEHQNLQNILDLTSEEIRKEHGKLKKSYTKKLVELVVESQESLSDIIKHNSTNAETKQINILVSSILSVALSELMYDDKTDNNIIVSQYVNLTAEFFGDSETGYVNAVLDKYVRQRQV